MGFLRKIVKKVKKGVKKVASGIKKVVKKISRSKLLKTIALVGAAVVTGGAAVGAFGGQLANSTMGTWLVEASKKILATPIVGTLAKPFEFVGAAVGTGAGKLTDVLGMGDFTGRAAEAATDVLPAGVQKVGEETGKEVVKETAGTFARGTIAGDVIRGVTTGVGTGYVMGKLQGDPEQYGALGAGLGEERGIEMNPLQVAYAQAGVNLNDAYSNLTFGTGDIGYLANDLYRQPLTGGMV